MTYPETLDYLFAQLPMYQRQGKAAYKADLATTWSLMDVLEHPYKKFKSIHVGGTNGKGSTSHMIASILQEAGYKVGLYTSPHLIDFRERVRINGEPVSEQFVMDFVQDYREQFESLNLSFFEWTVGLAFTYFATQKVDIAVIEVGMGGRLDSTNVIQPMLSVITNIGLDHTQFLGNTKAKIAAEKAGIIKSNTPVVIGEYNEETFPVFEQKALEQEAPLTLASKLDMNEYESDLLGSYQKMNQKTALVSIDQLKQLGLKVEESAIERGLLRVSRNTGLLGRWQQIQEQPKVLCDTAHNREGLTWVIQQLEESEYEDLHIVLGLVNDKNAQAILPLFPGFAKYYFTQAKIPRALNHLHLKEAAHESGLSGEAYGSVKEAIEDALGAMNPNDLLFIGGSTFVVADALSLWKTTFE